VCRLRTLVGECGMVAQQLSQSKRNELLYKQMLEIRTSNLAKAEAEVLFNPLLLSLYLRLKLLQVYFDISQRWHRSYYYTSNTDFDPSDLNFSAIESHYNPIL
jgi:hypothetical protein